MNRSRSLPAVIVPRPCVAAGTAVTFRLNARPKTRAAEHKGNRLNMKSALRARPRAAVDRAGSGALGPSNLNHQSPPSTRTAWGQLNKKRSPSRQRRGSLIPEWAICPLLDSTVAQRRPEAYGCEAAYSSAHSSGKASTNVSSFGRTPRGEVQRILTKTLRKDRSLRYQTLRICSSTCKLREDYGLGPGPVVVTASHGGLQPSHRECVDRALSRHAHHLEVDAAPALAILLLAPATSSNQSPSVDLQPHSWSARGGWSGSRTWRTQRVQRPARISAVDAGAGASALTGARAVAALTATTFTLNCYTNWRRRCPFVIGAT